MTPETGGARDGNGYIYNSHKISFRIIYIHLLALFFISYHLSLGI
jgi:hypothetical protein